MGTTRPPPHRGALHPRTANERLKEGWSACLVWSMTAAAAAHLAVFAAWPDHEISPPPRTAGPIVQLIPIASAAARSDSPENRADIPLAPPEHALSEEAVDPFDRWEVPAPRLATSSASTSDVTLPADQIAAWMVLDLITPELPTYALAVPNFSWPIIQNPNAIQRFLQSRYNPLHTHIAVGRSVAVRMWISARGVVERTEVDRSSGHEAMDEIATAMFDEVVEFSPARREGVAIPISVVISVPFDLPW
jgi:TonB family protein